MNFENNNNNKAISKISLNNTCKRHIQKKIDYMIRIVASKDNLVDLLLDINSKVRVLDTLGGCFLHCLQGRKLL